MANKKVADIFLYDSEPADWLDISVDQIDEQLYLGNLACARDSNQLDKLQITHVLTVDLVPLPRGSSCKKGLTYKYIKLADIPKEDLISHLPATNAFIKDAITNGGVVLVHCHFGVSRSAAVVIAYIMTEYKLDYDDAFELVRSRRRYVGPNVGFVAQLRLFGHMGCVLNKDDPRYKQFRLKLAGQKLREVLYGISQKKGERFLNMWPVYILKILPQSYSDLVKPDPGLIQERPEPIVYRCKNCRRIVASQRNIIPHMPKTMKVELAKKMAKPRPSTDTVSGPEETGQLLINRLKKLAGQINEMVVKADRYRPNIDLTAMAAETCLTPIDSRDTLKEDWKEYDMHDLSHEESSSSTDHEEHHLDASILCGVDSGTVCREMWFVEPMGWMQDVQKSPHGKLLCPKCQSKLGSFSWIMGCKCPCGQKVAPAFYLVPSKVEWSNVVQNVQITV